MTKNIETSTQVFIAHEDWEKERIYQFRYNIFIEEMSKQCHVDHQNKKMRDALDDTSILLYAAAGSEIVGTSRITMNYPDKFPEWLSDVFSLSKYQKILGKNTQIAFSTKVAILPAFRGSTVMYQLIAEHFKIFQQNNIVISFSGSNPHLIPMYEKIGYRQFTKNFSEPGHGLLIPFVIVTDDTEHLRAVRSPLHRLVKQSEHTSAIVERFKKEFPKVKDYINTQLLRKEDLWRYLQAIFDGSSQTDIHLLNKLNEKERLAFFKLGAIFSCTAGDCILSPNEISNGLYFLLSGELISESETGSTSLSPGQYFGNGLLPLIARTKKITALTPSDILIIPRQSFDKYRQSHPQIAKTILNALKKQFLS